METVSQALGIRVRHKPPQCACLRPFRPVIRSCKRTAPFNILAPRLPRPACAPARDGPRPSPPATSTRAGYGSVAKPRETANKYQESGATLNTPPAPRRLGVVMDPIE